MGDNVMQLPLVRQLASRYGEVFLASPWPQLYGELGNVRFLHPATENRELYGWTHFRENIDVQPKSLWVAEADVPAAAARFYWGSGGDVRQGINTRLSVTCPQIALPRRVSTHFRLRQDWLASARAWLDDNVPRGQPRVLLHVPTAPPGVELARDARFESFRQVYDEFCNCVAFFDAARVEPGICEPVGQIPMPVFSSFGPQVTTLWALAALADAVVTSPCHMGDLAAAFTRPTLLLSGGSLPARRVYDPRQDLCRLVAVEPEPFCECNLAYHDCHKTLDPQAVRAGFRRVLDLVEADAKCRR
jgi:hypothetical protein